MRLLGAVLVVLALVASVVLLTFRTSVDAPAPRDDAADNSTIEAEIPAQVSMSDAELPLGEQRLARMFPVEVPHNARNAHVRALLLDARLEPIGLAQDMDLGYVMEKMLAVPEHIHAVRLGFVAGSGALVECLRIPVADPLVLHCADEELSTLRIELLDSAGKPCIEAWTWRSELEQPRMAGPEAILNLPFHATGWLVEARGCARQRVLGAPEATLRVSMPPATRCALRIVKESGEAFPSARVLVPELDFRYTADANGNVLCEDLPENRDGLSLVISGSDEEHQVQPFPAGPGPTTVRVARSLRAEGRVLDAAMKPIEDAEIQCCALDSGVLAAVASTDILGHFRLPAIAPGPHLLVAREGTRTAVIECTLPASTLPDMLLPAQEGAAVIACTSNAGADLAGARTRLLVRGCVVHDQPTDAAGLAELPVIAGAELLVEHPLHEDMRLRAPGPGKTPVLLHARRTLKITVLAAESRSAIYRIVSTLRTAAGNVIWKDRESRNSLGYTSYQFTPPRGLGGEDLMLELTAADRTTFTHVWHDGSTTLDVLLALAAPLGGRVVSAASGAGLEGAQLALLDAAASGTTSGRNGEFAFASLARSPLRIRIEHEGFESLDVAVPATESGSPRDLGALALLPAGNISLAAPDGALPLSAHVRLEHLAGSVREIPLTHAGSHEIRRIRTGRWLAILHAPGNALDGDRRIADVEAGSTTHVEFRPHNNRATVRGIVERPDESFSVAGIMVRARLSDGSLLAESACTREGSFTLEDLPLTGCSVEAQLETAHGIFSGTMNLQLPPGESSLTLKLTRK